MFFPEFRRYVIAKSGTFFFLSINDLPLGLVYTYHPGACWDFPLVRTLESESMVVSLKEKEHSSTFKASTPDDIITLSFSSKNKVVSSDTRRQSYFRGKGGSQ